MLPTGRKFGRVTKNRQIKKMKKMKWPENSGAEYLAGFSVKDENWTNLKKELCKALFLSESGQEVDCFILSLIQKFYPLRPNIPSQQAEKSAKDNWQHCFAGGVGGSLTLLRPMHNWWCAVQCSGGFLETKFQYNFNIPLWPQPL